MSNWPPKDCPICGSTSLMKMTPIMDHSISGKEFSLGACQQCGFQLTLDAPNAEDIGPFYQADVYISHSDTSSSLTDRIYHLARSFMLKKKLRLVNKYSSKTGHLLDIGSGTGYFLQTMKAGGWSINGVEVDDSTRILSQDKFDIEVVSSLDDPSLSLHKYDAITMWHVMEHVHDLNRYWKHFIDKLAANGIVMIAVPNPESLDAKNYGNNWAAWDVPRHLWHFRSEDIKRIASNHGFDLIERIPMPLDAYYVSILSEKYKGSNSIMSLLKGLYRGLVSNLRSRRIEDRSSIIYIFKRSSTIA